MGLFHRQWASAAIASVGFIVIAACGDDKGVASLDQFYAPSASSSGEPSSSGGSSGTSSSGGPSDVTCGISTSGLVAYLPFDGDANVRGGSSLALTSGGSTPRFVPGQRGNALDGSSQVFLQAQSTISLLSWTACAWVKVGASTPNIGFMAVSSPTVLNSGIGSGGFTGEGCASNGVLTPYVTTPYIDCFSPSGVSLSPGSWSFVCLANDGEIGQVRWHVDGAVDTRGYQVSLQISSGSAIALAGGPSGGSAFDEFTLWSRALSKSEIQELASGSGCSLNGESR